MFSFFCGVSFAANHTLKKNKSTFKKATKIERLHDHTGVGPGPLPNDWNPADAKPNNASNTNTASGTIDNASGTSNASGTVNNASIAFAN